MLRAMAPSQRTWPRTCAPQTSIDSVSNMSPQTASSCPISALEGREVCIRKPAILGQIGAAEADHDVEAAIGIACSRPT